MSEDRLKEYLERLKEQGSSLTRLIVRPALRREVAKS